MSTNKKKAARKRKLLQTAARSAWANATPEQRERFRESRQRVEAFRGQEIQETRRSRFSLRRRTG